MPATTPTLLSESSIVLQSTRRNNYNYADTMITVQLF